MSTTDFLGLLPVSFGTLLMVFMLLVLVATNLLVLDPWLLLWLGLGLTTVKSLLEVFHKLASKDVAFELHPVVMSTTDFLSVLVLQVSGLDSGGELTPVPLGACPETVTVTI